MGQKINPLGFRLGTTQNHHSFWFAQPRFYSKSLQEDIKIRNCIKNYIEKNKKTKKNVKTISEVIGPIEIRKQMDMIHIIIHVGFPILLKKEEVIKELKINIQKEIHSVKRRLNISVAKVEEPYRQPYFLAEYIAFQLKRKVSFRKAMEKAVELTKKTSTKGVQVQIAGRLGGKEIARTERIREGRLPLQTIRAKIDYCSYPIRTIHGVLGLKIWIFVDEE